MFNPSLTLILQQLLAEGSPPRPDLFPDVRPLSWNKKTLFVNEYKLIPLCVTAFWRADECDEVMDYSYFEQDDRGVCLKVCWCYLMMSCQICSQIYSQIYSQICLYMLSDMKTLFLVVDAEMFGLFLWFNVVKLLFESFLQSSFLWNCLLHILFMNQSRDQCRDTHLYQHRPESVCHVPAV